VLRWAKSPFFIQNKNPLISGFFYEYPFSLAYVSKSIAFPNTFWKHHNTLARMDVTDEKIAWSKKKMCGNIE